MENNAPENLSNLKAESAGDNAKTSDQKVKAKAVVKVSRQNDFSHIHPSHAKHKLFGMDHEPGTF